MQKLLADYGMIFVLLGLCALFSVLTLTQQMPEGDEAAADLVERISRECQRTDLILAVGATNRPSATLAEKVGQELRDRGFANVRVVVGIPRDLRMALDQIAARR